MTKLLIVTTFAAFAFTAGPAAACDWKREASTKDPAVATTATPTQQTTSQATAAPAQPASVASDESAGKPVDASAPIVLITERR
jgi:hypothetical protein